ncbi:MAG: hypothetical protein D3921_08355 [Candidatus Electrothrix sp. AW1]|nr:hypothetical protein [Candidatus Electrothrix gigas]
MFDERAMHTAKKMLHLQEGKVPRLIINSIGKVDSVNSETTGLIGNAIFLFASFLLIFLP